MDDPVRDYLRSKGYAEYIVRGGLDYLMSAWEGVVDAIVDGEIPAYEEYLNDLHRRRMLQEALVFASDKEQEEYRMRINTADERLLPHLEPIESCICGDEAAVKQGYTRELHWWYFYRPRQVSASWTTE